MKSVFYLTIAAVFLCACSASPAVNESVTVRTNVDISELNNPNQNSLAQTNVNGSLSGSLTEMNGNKQTSVEKKPAAKDAPPVDPNAKPITQSAPDNSEFQSLMNNQGQPVEMRVFKNHPTILKVEKIYVTLENPMIKIYLKNGKTVNLTADKIGNPMQAPAEEIVNALNNGNSIPAPTKQP